MLSVDFEKAFDKIEISANGVGTEFRDMLKILYKSPTTTVINNGFWSEWIHPTRGVRQGDPISSIIFVLAVEILGIKVRSNPKIEGIQMGGNREMLNVQYVDDAWFALKPTQENLNNIIQELDDFANFTGLNVNFEKTVAFKLGLLRDTDAKYYTLKKLYWTDGSIKILGLYNNLDRNIMQELNYWKTLEKIKAILGLWANRSLSLIDKITVINSLIASLFIYKFMALPSPDDAFFDEYKRIILNFIWEHKLHRVKYSKLIQKYSDGGLALADLKAKDTALKAAWIARWQKKNRLNKIPWLYINLPIKDDRIWEVNMTVKDLESLNNQRGFDIGYQILHALVHVFYTTDFNIDHAHYTPLWYNSMVRHANRPFTSADLVNSNLNVLADIWYHDQKRYYTSTEVQECTDPAIDILTYNLLLSALPTIWKHQMREFNLEQDAKSRVDLIGNAIQPSKQIYWELVEKVCVRQDALIKIWMQELRLDIEITADSWANILNAPRTIKSSSKLRLLQYKLVNRTLVLNLLRSKWNRETSPLCKFCYTKNETIMHLFYECKLVQKLWKSLTRWAAYHFKIDIEITPELVIFNNYLGTLKRLINNMLLIMKQYIYSTKCKKNELTFCDYANVLHYYYTLEKIYARDGDQIKKFKNTWKKNMK